MSVGHRVNRQIRASHVKLVTEDGEMRGTTTLKEALAYAEQQGLDLVEVSPGMDESDPPVCKVLDFGKLRYESNKRKKHNKSHSQVMKEVKIGINIGEHDLQIKHRHIREFLEKRHKVRFVLECKGRQRYTTFNEDQKAFEQSLAQFADIAKIGAVAQSMKGAYASLSVILTPL